MAMYPDPNLFPQRAEELLARPVTAAEVPALLAANDELNRDVDETYSRLSRAKDEDTTDEAAAAAYLGFVTGILPEMQVLDDRMARKLLAVEGYEPPADLSSAWADMQEDVELFREENVPLITKLDELGQKYSELKGSMVIELDGERLTYDAAQAKLQEPDRALRERAYRAIDAAREAQRAASNEIFQEMLALRHRMARNAGLEDFREYQWRAYHRREYTPQDCLDLHDTVAEVVVPRLREVYERRRRIMELPSLRPYDLYADARGRAALKPFTTVKELEEGLKGVKRQTLRQARASGLVEERDLITPYVNDLDAVLDMERIRAAGLRIGVDPLGGSSLHYWDPIAERWGLDITVVNRVVDPTFGFMTLDHDGKIRMDCSSPYAMAGLVALKDEYDVAFGNDPDADRHGIVTRSGGLMNPNHYLAVAVEYLFAHRPNWPAGAAVGKTLVSSSMIDRVASSLGRRLVEVPVGFKWFVAGLVSGDLGFGGEESAGASFLRRDGGTWTTDKDGLIMGLLAAEIMAVTGSDPSQAYTRLTERFGEPRYARLDVPATTEQKAVLGRLGRDDVTATTLAGEPIVAVMSRAPGNDAALGGIKVTTESGWFAARPSGTEDLYKIYAESFRGAEHLATLQNEAKALVARTFESGESAAGGEG